MNSDPRDFDFKFDFSMQTKTPNCSCCVVTFWSHTSDDARCVKDGRPAWHGRDDLSAAIERALTQALGEERGAQARSSESRLDVQIGDVAVALGLVDGIGQLLDELQPDVAAQLRAVIDRPAAPEAPNWRQSNQHS